MQKALASAATPNLVGRSLRQEVGLRQPAVDSAWRPTLGVACRFVGFCRLCRRYQMYRPSRLRAARSLLSATRRLRSLGGNDETRTSRARASGVVVRWLPSDRYEIQLRSAVWRFVQFLRAAVPYVGRPERAAAGRLLRRLRRLVQPWRQLGIELPGRRLLCVRSV